nr:5406_t:CDS:2 [Entrophospora candida]
MNKKLLLKAQEEIEQGKEIAEREEQENEAKAPDGKIHNYEKMLSDVGNIPWYISDIKLDLKNVVSEIHLKVGIIHTLKK